MCDVERSCAIYYMQRYERCFENPYDDFVSIICSFSFEFNESFFTVPRCPQMTNAQIWV